MPSPPDTTGTIAAALSAAKASGSVNKRGLTRTITTATGEVKTISVNHPNPLGNRKPAPSKYKNHQDRTKALLGENYGKNNDGVFVCPEEDCPQASDRKDVIRKHVEFACRFRKARLAKGESDAAAHARRAGSAAASGNPSTDNAVAASAKEVKKAAVPEKKVSKKIVKKEPGTKAAKKPSKKVSKKAIQAIKREVSE